MTLDRGGRLRFLGFSLRLTRLGGLFLAIMLVVGGAAVNTGNNALMMLLGIGLGSYVISGVWSRQVLGQAEVSVRPPGELFAGAEVPVEIVLHNGSSVFPAYGLVLRDGSGRVLLMEPYLAAGRSVHRAVRVEFSRRGWRRLGAWRIEVVLPLGFFVKSKRAGDVRNVLVYPRLLRGAAAPAGTVPGTDPGARLSGRGREGDVLQLRPFREGDERRQVHWKQTARQERTIVMERQRRTADPAVLILDPRLRDPDDPVARERFEAVVSEAATEAMALLRSGHAVGLRIGSDTVVPPVEGFARRAALLRPLAEVEPVSWDEARSARRPGSYRTFAVRGGES